MDEYFNKMRNLGRQIDYETRKLEKTWETPHLLMSGHGDNVDEAIPYIEGFLSTMKEIQDQLIGDQETRTKEIASADEYLSSVDIFYQNMKQQCQEVESLLVDNGYKPKPKSSEHSSLDHSESETSILTPEQMENSITSPGSFCGSIDAAGKLESSHDPPKSIATPVIRRLASFGESDVWSGVGTPLNKYDSPYCDVRLK